ncbi:MAG: hypothetical protein K2L54_05630 [Clostridiales bacterium]|nr:hypothetical protein [Clostridiales bacterium]
MAYEYPMFSPHPKAKLYKRLTNDMPVELRNGDTITVQANRYACVSKRIKWIEYTEKQDTDEQPLDGLIIPNSYITIQTNSREKFDDGDIIQIIGDTPLAGFWLVMDGKSTDYVYTPKQVQKFQYLPLSSAGLS